MRAETLLWAGVGASVALTLLALLCWVGQRRHRLWDEFNMRHPMPVPKAPRAARRKYLHSDFPTEDLVEAVYLLKESLPVLNACMVSYDRDSDLQVRVRKFLTRLENSHGE